MKTHKMIKVMTQMIVETKNKLVLVVKPRMTQMIVKTKKELVLVVKPRMTKD